MTTTIAPVNGIEIAYETHGDPSGEPLLLVMGLGAQLIAWPIELCDALVDRGFFVIRYDNRDTGLSTKFDDPEGSDFMTSFLAAQAGQEVAVAYKLSDMAADGIALLDHLGIESAHVVGASMGGMIAQTMAIEHPTRVRTLTSIMSMTGEPEYGAPTPEALAILVQPTPTTREEAIASGRGVVEGDQQPGALRRGPWPSSARRRPTTGASTPPAWPASSFRSSRRGAGPRASRRSTCPPW